MPDKKPQLDWINNLRVIAMYAVIILHTASPLLFLYPKVNLNDWLAADFYNGLTRFGVPVFVMITGALLLHRDYELGDFLKKRIGRILLPFLFWSIVYIVYKWYDTDITFGSNAWANTLQILQLLRDGSFYHLWYVYMLIGLYLLIPVLSKFVRAASQKELLYFLLLWFVAILIGRPYFTQFGSQIGLEYFTGYAGYLVLGHYLAYTQISIKNPCLWLWLLFGIVLVLIVLGTYLFSDHYQTLSTLMYEPIGPAVVLLSASVFLLARFIKVKLPAGVKRVRDVAGGNTFGIYLSHALILALLDNVLNINSDMCAPIISIPITALICFILSLLLVYVLGKLPFGKWLTA
jgi:surface polysaccharide O-acyltransferase-like enzyme